MHDQDEERSSDDVPARPLPSDPLAFRRDPHLRNTLLKKLHKNADTRRKIQAQVVELFLAGMPMSKIAQELEAVHGKHLNREAPYNYLLFAAVDGQLLYAPPRNAMLEQCLARCPNRGEVLVTDHPWPSAAAPLATKGAELVLRLIRACAARGVSPVHLGIGIGHTSGLVIDALSRLYRAALDVPPLVIHALATSWTFWDHSENPHTFFGFLRARGRASAEFVGMLGPPAVKADKYPALKRDKFLAEAFARRGEVDIVVTSLASSKDERGYLYKYLTCYDRPGAIKLLEERGWVGDVHLRPYSEKGPIAFPRGVVKPVVLFELPEMVELARKPDKHVVLLCNSGPSGETDKSAALEPLLKRPALHVWNHLLLDVKTAEAVVANNPTWGRPTDA